jgi:UDP-GlcNAc:undecaprenyl-phosphate/decaprenyl-phosphate GlcNAc-1-phosphate transferase
MTLLAALDLPLPVPSAHLFAVFLGSLLLCSFLTWLTLRVQGGVGMDHPDDHRKQHGGATSRLGGLPIFLTLAAGMCYALYHLGDKLDALVPILICNALMFSVGFLDDLKPVGAKVKLVGQIGVACVMFTMGNSIEMLSNPLGTGQLSLGWMSLVVTVLWLIAVPNIINLIDGMDGLATGFGVFLCMTLAVVGHFALRPDVVMMAAVMTGALAGFLFFNFPPARIFLGDGGAYMIGFFVASVSLSSSRKGYVVGSLLVVIVALGVPILDTLFAIIRRAIRGVPVFRADAEHIHHRLIALGFSKGEALAVMYAACVVLSLVGITILAARGLGLVMALATFCVLGLAAARYLGYVRRLFGIRQQVSEAMVSRTEVEFAKAYGRVLELEADRLEGPQEFADLLKHSLNRMGLSLAVANESKTITVKLESGHRWTVQGLRDDWKHDPVRRCVECLMGGLEVALERWGTVPGACVEEPTTSTKGATKS